jgi:hypothetical protein
MMVKNTYKIYYSVKNIFFSINNLGRMSCSNFNCSKRLPSTEFPKEFSLCTKCTKLKRTPTRFYCNSCSGVTAPGPMPSSSRTEEIPCSDGREGYILEEDKQGAIPIIPGNIICSNGIEYLYCIYCPPGNK